MSDNVFSLIIRFIYKIQIYYWKIKWVFKRHPLQTVNKLDATKLYTPLIGFYAGNEAVVFWQQEKFVTLFFPYDNSVHSYGYDEIEIF